MQICDGTEIQCREMVVDGGFTEFVHVVRSLEAARCACGAEGNQYAINVLYAMPEGPRG